MYICTARPRRYSLIKFIPGPITISKCSFLHGITNWYELMIIRFFRTIKYLQVTERKIYYDSAHSYLNFPLYAVVATHCVTSQSITTPWLKHFPRYWLFVRVTGFPKASGAELWCFLWSAPEQTGDQSIRTPMIWDTIAPIMTPPYRYWGIYVVLWSGPFTTAQKTSDYCYYHKSTHSTVYPSRGSQNRLASFGKAIS